MSTATKEAPIITKLTQPQLRNNRIAIYKKHIKTRALNKGVNGEVFHVPESLVARQNNFKLFVAENFVDEMSESGLWPVNKTALPVYQKLKAYSETPYGAAMIYRILEDNKKAILHKRRIFKVQYDDGVTGQSPLGAFD